MNILCRVGLHKWVEYVFADNSGMRLFQGPDFPHAHRNCVRSDCGKIQYGLKHVVSDFMGIDVTIRWVDERPATFVSLSGCCSL